MTRQLCRTFTPEFKAQIVKLYQSGKPRQEMLAEYALGASTFERWVHQFNHSGSFKHQDNLSEAERELLIVKKKLNQAALIMSRK